jgi:NADH-quinone oxidoreductase subunit H
LIPALIGFAVIPWGDGKLTLFGVTFRPFVTDLNIGILYLLALSSVGAYGILLGGWASNSKYSLLGGLRSAAQVISYELALGMSLVGVLLLAGSLSLVKIAQAQAGGFWHWYAFALPFPQIVALVLYGIAAAWPRPTARRSTCRRPSRNWWRAFTPSTRACGSRSSSWPSTQHDSRLVHRRDRLLADGTRRFRSSILFDVWFLLKVYVSFFFFWIGRHLPLAVRPVDDVRGRSIPKVGQHPSRR